MSVRVQTADFDVARELAALRAGDPKVGAVAAFIGTVRDVNDGSSVAGLTLEHYPGMTEKALAAIVDEAKSRWDILDALVVHRVGPLAPADQIVLVGVTSAHRGEAFAACEFIMDYLKTRAPFWKKETTPDGARWVEARASDDDAAARWSAAPELRRVSGTVAALLGVDWGTTSARAYRLDSRGEVLGVRTAPLGIQQVTGSYPEALAALLGDWAGEAAPRLACGMIGSRQGWVEAPYVELSKRARRARPRDRAHGRR